VRIAHAQAALLALATLTPAAVEAAVEHEADSNHGGFDLSRVAFDATVGAGADPYLLLAIVTSGAALPVKSATFAGTPLDLVGAVSSPAANCRIEWWGQVAPVVGTQPVVVDLAASAAHLEVAVVTYHGVSPLHPTGPLAIATGTGPSSVTVTGAAAGDVALDGVCAWSPTSILAMAGPLQTGRWHYSIGSLSSAGSDHPGGAAVTMTWTAGGSGNMEWGALGVALLAADGTGGRLPATVNLEIGSAGCAVGQGQSRPPAGPVSVIVGWLLGWLWIRRRREPKPPVRVELPADAPQHLPTARWPRPRRLPRERARPRRAHVRACQGRRSGRPDRAGSSL
jgi:hypothetical protein